MFQLHSARGTAARGHDERLNGDDAAPRCIGQVEVAMALEARGTCCSPVASLAPRPSLLPLPSLR